MNKNFQEILLNEIKDLMQPLIAAGLYEERRAFLLYQIGWDINKFDNTLLGNLIDLFSDFSTSYQGLVNLVQNPPENIQDLKSALNTLKSIFDTLEGINTIANGSAQSGLHGLSELSKDLTDYLIIKYLRKKSPSLYYFAVLFAIIKVKEESSMTLPVLDSANKLVRLPVQKAELNYSNISRFFSDTKGLFNDEYFPTEILDAYFTADKLFPRLANLLNSFGMTALYQPNDADITEPGSGVLSIVLSKDSSEVLFGVNLLLTDQNSGNIGLVIAPFGTLAYTQKFKTIQIDLSLSAIIEAFAISSTGFTFPDTFSGSRIEGILRATKLPGKSGDAILIGSTTGTRFQVANFSVSGDVKVSTSAVNYGIFTHLEKASIVISSGDGDGFIKRVLPAEGLKIDFDLIVGWDNINGLHIVGSGGFQAVIPINKTILNVIKINSIKIGLSTGGTDISLNAGTSGSLFLGPIKATIEDVGLQGVISFPSNGGNLGVANIDFDFKPPTGIGISIDSSGVKGAGFLSIDKVNKRYVGALELTINKKISVKAIGIVNTQLPGGADGYSLLLLITAEFQPIQIGFGFTLNGVGGLIALHRTTKLDVLRAGVKDNSLDNILFPQNPVENINTIVSDLEKAFPIQEGRHTFGIMALIGWGSPNLITGELGVIIEVPDPVRIAILGVIRSVLPDKDNPILQLQINFLGTIDFGTKFITFDASIYDSKLKNITLSGDMAFRLKYGDNPTFLLTVGGFHPSYSPPPLNLPALSRLTAAIINEPNIKLILSTYFAVTSNTVQLGARIDGYLAAGGFSVQGYLSFDALFQFSPFYFIVQIGASMSLKKGSKDLFSVYVDFSLSGPTPYRANGKASFKLLGVKIQFSFDKTFGDTQSVTYPTIDLMPKILEALGEKGNWETVFNNGNDFKAVQLRTVDESELVIDANGTLRIRQNIVPLKIAIEKYGNRKPQGGTQTFAITKLVVGSKTYSVTGLTDVSDFFAPAEYKNYPASSKLSLPSFSQFPCGISVQTTDNDLAINYTIDKDIFYEVIVLDTNPIDEKDELREALSKVSLSDLGIDELIFDAHVKSGVIADSPLSTSKRPKQTEQQVKIKQEGYVVVNKSNLIPHDALSVKAGMIEAQEYYEKLVKQNPVLSKQLQIVPEYSINA